MHTLPKCTLAIRESGILLLLLLTDPGFSRARVSTFGLLLLLLLLLLRCCCRCLPLSLSPQRPDLGSSVSLMK